MKRALAIFIGTLFLFALAILLIRWYFHHERTAALNRPGCFDVCA